MPKQGNTAPPTTQAAPGATRLERLTIPLSLLYPDPKNYKQHPPAQLKKLDASLQRFGQIKPIIVRHKDANGYKIVAGRGVTLAATIRFAAGDARFASMDAFIAPPDWSDEQARGYLVADNETGNEATSDEELLLDLLKEQQDAGYDLNSVGADEEQLRQMLAKGMREGGPDYDDGSDQGDDVQPRETLGRTPEEKLDAYNFGTIRQIVLLFDPEEYARVVDAFAAIRDKQPELETNTDVVLHLLDFYQQHGTALNGEVPVSQRSH